MFSASRLSYVEDSNGNSGRSRRRRSFSGDGFSHHHSPHGLLSESHVETGDPASAGTMGGRYHTDDADSGQAIDGAVSRHGKQSQQVRQGFQEHMTGRNGRPEVEGSALDGAGIRSQGRQGETMARDTRHTRNSHKSRRTAPPQLGSEYVGDTGGRTAQRFYFVSEDDPSDITLEDSLLRTDGGTRHHIYANTAMRTRGGSSGEVKLMRSSRTHTAQKPIISDRRLHDENIERVNTKTGVARDVHNRKNGTSGQQSTSPMRRAPMTKAQKRLLYGNLSDDAMASGKSWMSLLRR